MYGRPRYCSGRLKACTSRLNGNTVYQVHAIVAWGFWALFPFSRLVHAWSIPVQYLGRPYILYRRRYAAPTDRAR